jgi:hypothetical protein
MIYASSSLMSLIVNKIFKKILVDNIIIENKLITFYNKTTLNNKNEFELFQKTENKG